MKALSLLLLLPSLAFGQGLSLTAPGVTGGGKVLWQAPFATPGCYASGQTAGASSAISITRTTKGTVALTSDPSALTECASGEFRVGYQGLLVEPARTNYALQSNTMSTGTAATSPWSLTGASPVVATVAGAPMGGTWAELSGGASSARLVQDITIPSSTTVTGSVWTTKPSGSGTTQFRLTSVSTPSAPSACTCIRSTGAACTASISTNSCIVTAASVGTTPERLSLTGTWSAQTTINMMLIVDSDGTANRFSGAQLEVGTYPTSLIVTTSTATARNADQVSATVPAVPGDATGKWCVAVTATPENGRAWQADGAGANVAWGIGQTSGGLRAVTSNSNFFVFDAAAASKIGTYTAPAAASHRIVSCNNQGTLSLAIDGATVALTMTGAGTGILGAAQTALFIGQSTASAGQFGGYLKSLKLCSKISGPKDCK